MSTKTNVIPEGELREIPLEQLHESPWNPRQYYPEAAMAELTESMRASGWRPWLPAVVRPRAEGGFEIGAAHRRTRAARAAGIELVPCIVKAMSDAEFLDVLNFDNCGREDVHPLHEAAGWVAWMEKTGKGVLDIAARIGQSKEYVYQRLKYSALIDDARKAFLDGEISAGHAILIARLQAKEQKKALKFCEPPKWDPARKRSVRDLASWIRRGYLDLSDAPFDLSADNLIAVAGSCGGCAKRTKNDPGLIPEELLSSPQIADETDDQCTDPSCFEAKTAAHLVQIKLQVPSTIEISTSEYSTPKKGVLAPSQYQKVSESTPGAKAAVVVQGSEIGSVIYIRQVSSRKDDNYAEKQKREVEARRKKVAGETKIRLAILSAIRAKVGGLTRGDIEGILGEILQSTRESAGVLFGFYGLDQPTDEGWNNGSRLAAVIAKLSELDLYRLAVEVPLLDDFDDFSIIRNEPATRLLAAAKRYKVDAAKIRATMEEAAKEAEGGTRREVDKPAAKKKAAKPATKKTPAKKTAPATKKASPAKTKAVARKTK